MNFTPERVADWYRNALDHVERGWFNELGSGGRDRLPALLASKHGRRALSAAFRARYGWPRFPSGELDSDLAWVCAGSGPLHALARRLGAIACADVLRRAVVGEQVAAARAALGPTLYAEVLGLTSSERAALRAPDSARFDVLRALRAGRGGDYFDRYGLRLLLRAAYTPFASQCVQFAFAPEMRHINPCERVARRDILSWISTLFERGLVTDA